MRAVRRAFFPICRNAFLRLENLSGRMSFSKKSTENDRNIYKKKKNVALEKTSKVQDLIRLLEPENNLSHFQTKQKITAFQELLFLTRLSERRLDQSCHNAKDKLNKIVSDILDDHS